MPFQRLHKAIYKGCGDKNHNPRKGTEVFLFHGFFSLPVRDKNHNPRKGTEFSTVCQTFARLAIWR